MLSRALFGLLGALALAGRLDADSPPEAPEPAARLILIGDAGADPSEPGAGFVAEVQRWVSAHPAPTTVVFLGDNFYPRSAKAETISTVFARQLAVGPARSDVLFVPGNHDWHRFGAGLADTLLSGRRKTIAAHARASWSPPLGELGPEVVDKQLFRLVAIDSERWRVAARRCELHFAPECERLHESEGRLATELRRRGAPPAIVVAHHPLHTHGEHGGGCGGNFLQIGGQDVHDRPYRAYIASVGGVIRSTRPLLFAAGHDHSLQWERNAEFGAHVVSGAGSEATRICSPEDADGQSWAQLGFMTVDFARGKPPLLRVFARDADALREKRSEPLTP